MHCCLDFVFMDQYNTSTNFTAYLASRVRAITAETMGVAALVPPNDRVHPPPTAVAVCE